MFVCIIWFHLIPPLRIVTWRPRVYLYVWEPRPPLNKYFDFDIIWTMGHFNDYTGSQTRGIFPVSRNIMRYHKYQLLKHHPPTPKKYPCRSQPQYSWTWVSAPLINIKGRVITYNIFYAGTKSKSWGYLTYQDKCNRCLLTDPNPPTEKSRVRHRLDIIEDFIYDLFVLYLSDTIRVDVTRRRRLIILATLP